MALRISITNASAFRYRGRDEIIKSATNALIRNGVRHGRVDIILVDNTTIKRLHKQWFADNTITDVITFPIEPEPPILAEIYISVPQAKVQAEENNVTLGNELCRLAVHGALHLAGFTDHTDEDRNAMRKLENRYIPH